MSYTSWTPTDTNSLSHTHVTHPWQQFGQSCELQTGASPLHTPNRGGQVATTRQESCWPGNALVSVSWGLESAPTVTHEHAQQVQRPRPGRSIRVCGESPGYPNLEIHTRRTRASLFNRLSHAVCQNAYLFHLRSLSDSRLQLGHKDVSRNHHLEVISAQRFDVHIDHRAAIALFDCPASFPTMRSAIARHVSRLNLASRRKGSANTSRG